MGRDAESAAQSRETSRVCCVPHPCLQTATSFGRSAAKWRAAHPKRAFRATLCNSSRSPPPRWADTARRSASPRCAANADARPRDGQARQRTRECPVQLHCAYRAQLPRGPGRLSLYRSSYYIRKESRVTATSRAVAICGQSVIAGPDQRRIAVSFRATAAHETNAAATYFSYPAPLFHHRRRNRHLCHQRCTRWGRGNEG